MESQKERLIKKYTALCGKECISKIIVPLEQIDLIEKKAFSLIHNTALPASLSDYVKCLSDFVKVISHSEKEINYILGITKITDGRITTHTTE